VRNLHTRSQDSNLFSFAPGLFGLYPGMYRLVLVILRCNDFSPS
jgi:hypothetical protein